MPVVPLLARVTRRRFLRLAGLGILSAIAAACGLPVLSPSSSVRITPSPSDETAPSPSAEPDVPLRDKIGQMLLLGFRGLSVEEASSVIADIRDHALGGVLLFDRDVPTGSSVRNIATPQQVAALVAGLQAAAATPLIVAVDEEGGLVARLDERHGFPPTVSEHEMGLRDDATYTARQAGQMAETLRAAGINLNLAPVVDLDVNPTNPIIGALDRSFSADPGVVVAQASAFIDAHHAVGVSCTVKHFPGHGSSTGDTHLGVVDVTGTWTAVELDPYRQLVAAGLADAILTAHVFNARLDATYPATLSRATISGILREELGYDGLVLSDDMQMAAIRDQFGHDDAVRLAINAGVDILTIANQQVFEEGIVGRTIDSVASFVADGSISLDRIDEAYRRIQDFKAGRMAALR